MAEIVAYLVDGELMCPECAEEAEGSPKIAIYEGSWEPPRIVVCDSCKEPIPFSPSKEGMEWILREFEEVGEDKDKLEEKYGKIALDWLEIAQEHKRGQEEQQKKRQGGQEEVTLEKMRLLKYLTCHLKRVM